MKVLLNQICSALLFVLFAVGAVEGRHRNALGGFARAHELAHDGEFIKFTVNQACRVMVELCAEGSVTLPALSKEAPHVSKWDPFCKWSPRGGTKQSALFEQRAQALSGMDYNWVDASSLSTLCEAGIKWLAGEKCAADNTLASTDVRNGEYIIQQKCKLRQYKYATSKTFSKSAGGSASASAAAASAAGPAAASSLAPSGSPKASPKDD